MEPDPDHQRRRDQRGCHLILGGAQGQGDSNEGSRQAGRAGVGLCKCKSVGTRRECGDVHLYACICNLNTMGGVKTLLPAVVTHHLHPSRPPPQREAAAKSEISSLLEGRGALYERQEGGPKESDGAPGDTEGRRAEATRRMEITRTKFNRLRSIGIAAEQVR